MELVRVYTKQWCDQIRALNTLTTRNKNGEEFTTEPEIIIIVKERVGCRACGCPLDVGVKAIRFRVFSGFEGKKIPASFSYMHASNCWEPGFVQTMQLYRVPGVMRWVDTSGELYDSFYDYNRPTLMGNDASSERIPSLVGFSVVSNKATGIKSQNHLRTIQKTEAAAKMKALNTASTSYRRESHCGYRCDDGCQGFCTLFKETA